MRVNIYAEEMTDRIEIISKTIEGQDFTGCRFYLELPVTQPGLDPRDVPTQIRGPFMHGPDDDDSAAVTFWGKQDLRPVLIQAVDLLDDHYANGKTSVEFPLRCATVKTVAAILEIASERKRQIEVEGWSTDHDDEHDAGSLAAAGACYAASAACELDPINGTPIENIADAAIHWPFHESWFKTTTPRRDLIKAAALIVAEIERIDRMADLEAHYHAEGKKLDSDSDKPIG